ncbi:MAG: SWIM zinc finger family protein [Caldilineaceae bacterium]
MLTQNRIYLPTEEEISTTLGRAACRAPSLRSRLNRAGDLLRAQALRFERGEWFCDGAADPNGDPQDIHKVYRVDFSTCECPDCQSRRAVVGGAAYCKHLLALLALRCICLDHLRSRLLGSMNDPGAYRASRRAPNAALLLFDKIEPHCLALYAWADATHMRPRWVCSLARTESGTERGLAFASPGHLGAFAEWLRGAQPLPPELEALVLYRRLRALGFEEEDAAGAADAALVPLRLAA